MFNKFAKIEIVGSRNNPQKLGEYHLSVDKDGVFREVYQIANAFKTSTECGILTFFGEEGKI